MTLDVLHATLIQSLYGPDTIILELNIPNGTFPFNGNATVKLEVAAGDGFRYLQTHFKGTRYERLEEHAYCDGIDLNNYYEWNVTKGII